jgi:(p)ppGpp synthase/HD superfamily hydrolase
LPTALSDRFERALAYAHRLHAGQKRKLTETPYISHLLAVASLVLEHGGDEDEAIAALLHDGPEDVDGRNTLKEIRDLFGIRVADIVDGCTDTYERPKPPWKRRKKDYVEHLRKASSSVSLVAAADKLHNARSILTDYRTTGGRIWDRFNAPREDSLWYYRAVVDALRRDRASPLIEELDRVVAELERLP